MLNWKNPDYRPVFKRRWEALQRLRREPQTLPLLKGYYREHPAAFINDWGITYDPRNVERKLPAIIPFILYPKQVEWIDYVIRKWRAQESGLTEKSRECGVTWEAIALACHWCIFYEGMSIGFGSRKEEYVDKIGDPKSIFEKGRMFMSALPGEFRAGWTRKDHAPHMRLQFPETNSSIGGEGGDNIGRGDRRGVYFVDEAAHLEHPDLVDAALSATTNCRIDISSVNGMGNSFAVRRHSGNVEVFTFHWRDDPRKDDEWYRKITLDKDPAIIAQELDINYLASTEGALIKSEWVQAAIDAHEKLHFEPTGEKRAAYDVADQGPDYNACGFAYGVVVLALEQWSGKGGDIFASVRRCFDFCDEHGIRHLRYDADGMGASARGDGRVINAQRKEVGIGLIEIVPFRGSGEIVDPEAEDVKGIKNIDFFSNFKAQSWWSLRTRFIRTWRCVVEGPARRYSPDELISLSSKIPLLSKLCVELSQPTVTVNTAGKRVIDKTPDGGRSPNLADNVMMLFAPGKRKMVISDAVLKRARGYR
jgi:phage terminase large subunit